MATNKMTEFHFNGKTALVTGAGRGIGRAIAIALSSAGAVTYALSRTKEHLDGLVSEHPNIRPVCVDLANWESTKKAVDELGQIDLLVNNAAIYHEQPFLEVDPQSFDSLMNVNVKAVINVSQVVAKRLIERQCPGAIVNISSDSAYAVFSNGTSYSASKAALDMLSRMMATELGRHQIRVNIVNPSVVNTDILKDVDSAILDHCKARAPLGTFSEVEDVANAVMFLLSDSARNINGINLIVDGGISIQG